MKSYDRAVWELALKDTLTRLRHPVRDLVEFLLIFGITWRVIFQIRNQGVAVDYAIQTLTAFFIAGAAVLVFNFVWSLAHAPRTIYYEQARTIESLSQSTLPAEQKKSLIVLRRRGEEIMGAGQKNLQIDGRDWRDVFRLWHSDVRQQIASEIDEATAMQFEDAVSISPTYTEGDIFRVYECVEWLRKKIKSYDQPIEIHNKIQSGPGYMV